MEVSDVGAASMEVSEVRVLVVGVKVIEFGFLLIGGGDLIERKRKHIGKKKKGAMLVFKIYQYIAHKNVYMPNKIIRKYLS